MRLFLVRHGETDWNREGRFQGQRDSRLNTTGHRQAYMVAAYLAGHEFESMVASPLARALETAIKIGQLNSICGGNEEAKSVEIIGELTEINHGDWEGLLSAEVTERWDELFKQWHSEPHLVTMPGEGGESLEDVQQRAVSAVAGLAERHSDDVLVVSHDAVIKVLLCHFLGIQLANFWRFQIANCSLSVVELQEGKPPRVSLVGDAHYLGGGFASVEQKAL